MTRRLALFLALAFTLLLSATPALAHGSGKSTSSVASRISLPVGFQPEGITAGPDRTFYVGSIANGAIYRGSFDTGRGSIFIPGATGRSAAGTFYEARHDRLWVAGATTHEVRAYDGSTGALLATYTFGGGFLNDLIATKDAVYITDSNSRQLDVVPFGKGGALPPPSGAFVLPLTGDFVLQAGFNANGIVEASKWLVLVQSNTGFLFRVDPATGVTRRIDLGGYSVLNGDGVEIHGRTIYVIRNQNNLVAVLKADGSFESAELQGELTSPGNLDFPTTGVLEGSNLWVVNARFTNASPATADYWITLLKTKV